MVNPPIGLALNAVTMVAANKIPMIQQWWFKPVLRIVQGIKVVGYGDDAVHFVTYTITNIGSRFSIIKGVVLETGYTRIDGGYKTHHLPPQIPYNIDKPSFDTFPYRLEPDEYFTVYFEESDLIAKAHEYGFDGQLAGYRLHCQDTRGNSIFSDNWSFFESPTSATRREDPGHRYITPESYQAIQRKRILKLRMNKLLKSIFG